MGAVRNLPGLQSNTLPANDDGSSAGKVFFGFAVNFFGTSYDGCYLNENGNITFTGPQSTYTPYGLSIDVPQPIIAAFFADIDTRGPGSGLTTWGQDALAGNMVWGANWPSVGYYPNQTAHTNTFQLLIIQRADIGDGAFDIEFNYDSIGWETGTASGGNVDGRGGNSARAGYSNGASGNARVFYELDGSGHNGAFLDDAPNNTALRVRQINSDTPGRCVFAVRGGMVESVADAPTPPSFVAVGRFSASGNPEIAISAPV